MRFILQRVSRASVEVEGESIAAIGHGLLVLAGVEQGDGQEQARQSARRIASLRIFEDAEGRTNLDLRQAGGSLLLVPNFTLAADLERGRRPSFGRAASPDVAVGLLDELAATLAAEGFPVQRGRFGARMAVELVNDGPATYLLEVAPDGDG